MRGAIRDGKTLPLVRPMLAVSSPPFDSDKHLFEIKWDGYRSLAYLDDRTIIRSRNLVDLTAKFPELSRLHQRVKRLPAIIDGEIVIFEAGRPSFAGLQARGRMDGNKKAGRATLLTPAVFIAFDVLYTGGGSVMEKSLEERKDILQDMVEQSDELVLSRFIHAEGLAYYNACVGEGLEGVIAKRLDSVYLPGRRSNSWQKFKNTREADLVISGYQKGTGGRLLGSLLLGGYRDGRLVYQGKVGTGFSEQEAVLLLEKLEKLEVDQNILVVPPKEIKQARWVKPVLVCAVGYLTLTAEGYLRHPVYKGLRSDKTPNECGVATE
ncbi:putative DNA ligase-like protein [Pelotomaculum schinkii]|uniref:DNA ligase (ATP) n=1 Tax=Pelotomaculum schinkii TaxID=78350 RepID=A0A4Y7RD83_9FIRM|nr:non-homologous end-joining DNA ligase [Pelotomaculum schinkii]TEB06719.1 putative DNA ligase-like protein [Pelotomaculum schinkii]